MDLMNLSLTALVAIGIVNVISFFKPDMDSRLKWSASFAAALLVSFIPESFGVILLDHIRQALEAAFVGSGIYKVAQKIGGQ